MHRQERLRGIQQGRRNKYLRMNSICNRLGVFSLRGVIICMMTACSVCASIPNFVQESIYTSNQAAVSEIVEVDHSAVVFLNDGLNAGLDVGMMATVRRGDIEIASVLIVASEKMKSAAMILELTNDQSIEVGDIVKLKTTRLS